MKFFSAFAGIGGFDLGIKRAIPDAECIGYTEGISDSQRYKCLGNAVTVNVIEAIAKRFT